MAEREILAFAGFAEPVSSLTHLAGALLIWLGSGRLRPLAGASGVRRWSIFVYVLSSCGMFLFSSLYHLASPTHPLHGFFWRMDHAMIWLTIASTVVAIHTLANLGSGLLGWVTWGCALLGLLVEQLYLTDMPPWLSPTLYVSLGWFGLVPLWRLTRARGLRFSIPIAIAGALCTLGGICDAREWPLLSEGVIEGHEVMHACILSGLVFFYVAVLRCARLPLSEVPANLKRATADLQAELAAASG